MNLDPEIIEQSVDDYVNELYSKLHDAEEAVSRHESMASPTREEIKSNMASEITYGDNKEKNEEHLDYEQDLANRWNL